MSYHQTSVEGNLIGIIDHCSKAIQTCYSTIRTLSNAPDISETEESVLINRKALVADLLKLRSEAEQLLMKL
jgi:hypothetical protein